MKLTKKTSEIIKQNRDDRIDQIIKKIEKFDSIKPNETVWSEQRLLEAVRSSTMIDPKFDHPRYS